VEERIASNPGLSLAGVRLVDSRLT
jgi:hypothetical protein